MLCKSHPPLSKYAPIWHFLCDPLCVVCSLYLQHTGGVYCLAYSNGYVFSGSNDFECFQWRARARQSLLPPPYRLKPKPGYPVNL